MRYLSITKPGIIFGNIVTLCGGFFLGSASHVDITLLFATIIGMSLVIAAGCVLNNCIDRDIDFLMERTRNRVLVQGFVSIKAAIVYAIFLGLSGFFILYWRTNLLTVVVALIGLIFYVAIYTLYTKRRSIYGTLVGGIAGAVPPVVGYVSVTNRFDIGAIVLFFILFLWQIPHFYAISIYRLNDYRAAAIPILPLKKNLFYTKLSMLVYTFAFAVAAVMPSFLGYTGVVYFSVALILSLIWLGLGLQGIKTKHERAWARKTFIFSIITITVLCLTMAIKQ